MKIKDLFVLPPGDQNLLNHGVVTINSKVDEAAIKLARHELQTFVCEGEYKDGLVRILDTYLKNFDQPKQPAVWVSGFFGSGKSHLVKMLGYLWSDFEFPDGKTARTIKALPEDVKELLVELDRKQKKFGTLSIAGTLKDFPANDIRNSFLQLFLDALGFPPQAHHFQFVFWLMSEGIYDDLKALVESQGKSFRQEYENLFVSSAIAKGILQLKPDYAASEAQVRENFKANFKRRDNINKDEMLNVIRNQVIKSKYGGKIPCTAIVLDEVQQFIGTDTDKAIDVQNLAEEISESFDGRFLLIGTGQNALTENQYLQRLLARFPVKVSLSNTDVDKVTRKTILAKKPAVVDSITKHMDSHLGEISRNLQQTQFAYTNSSDHPYLSSDYPILPSTKKFWEKILQIIDTAGTSGQLRSQLRIVNDSVVTVAEKEMGAVVPGDFIFEEKQSQLIQNAQLLNETSSNIQRKKAAGGDSLLDGRILSIVFLLDLYANNVSGNRLPANEQTIADLLLDSLDGNSDLFRRKVKERVAHLVDTKELMPIGDEYKLQTKVGTEWEQEYQKYVTKLNNTGDDQIQAYRKNKFNDFFTTKTAGINILQGQSKQKRLFEIFSGTELPKTESKLLVWIRDGWLENDKQVLEQIRAAGNETPLVYVFVNKLHEEEIKRDVTKYMAADLTLQTKGNPSTIEGEQARKSMETRKAMAEISLIELIEKVAMEADVFMAGGTKVDTDSIEGNIKSALEKIAERQFPDFHKADYKDWDKALRKAFDQKPDALHAIGFNGVVEAHPVAIEILRFIGSGSKKGSDIRSNFEKSPYGWSRDAIDAIILMLRLTDQISSTESNLTQQSIGRAEFKKEKHILLAEDKLKLRKLFQDCGINRKPSEEFAASNEFIHALKQLAENVSGSSPKPEPINIQFLKEIENFDGNERLINVVNQKDALLSNFNEWTVQKELLDERWNNWELLMSLMEFAPADVTFDELRKQFDAVKNDRLLFHQPDLIEPLLNRLTDKQRELLHAAKKKYNGIYDGEMKLLQANEYFAKLSAEQKHSILVKHQLLAKPEIKSVDSRGLLNELQKVSLDNWQTKIAALPAQFQSALQDAILLSKPQAKTFSLPRKTINNKQELDSYITDLKDQLGDMLDEGDSIILQ